MTLTTPHRVSVNSWMGRFVVRLGLKDERTRLASNSSSAAPGETDAAASTSASASTAVPDVVRTADGTTEDVPSRPEIASLDSAQANTATGGAAAVNAAGNSVECDRRPPNTNPEVQEGSMRDRAGTNGPCRVSGSMAAATGAENKAAGDHEDGNDEVFHSALQLADENNLEGLGARGCASLVHQDTLFGDMQVSETLIVGQLHRGTCIFNTPEYVCPLLKSWASCDPATMFHL